jgi:hypothetical protein
LFHADGETDMTKLIAALRNVANAPDNERGLGNQKNGGSRNEVLPHLLVFTRTHYQ